jgi:hypothetical protein
MTVVHVFWDDGTVSSYRFDNRRAAHSFAEEIHARGDKAFGNGNIVCMADGGGQARIRARVKARQLGAISVIVREVCRRGPA